MKNEEFIANDLLRCYYCKRERFAFLLSLPAEFAGAGFSNVSLDIEGYKIAGKGKI
jgi:PP-loop superfamily ATP-utilizing enzyme